MDQHAYKQPNHILDKEVIHSAHRQLQQQNAIGCKVPKWWRQDQYKIAPVATVGSSAHRWDGREWGGLLVGILNHPRMAQDTLDGQSVHGVVLQQSPNQVLGARANVCLGRECIFHLQTHMQVSARC